MDQNQIPQPRYRTDDTNFEDDVLLLEENYFEESDEDSFSPDEEHFHLQDSDNDDPYFVYNHVEGDNWSSEDDSDDDSVFSVSDITADEVANAQSRNIDMEIPEVHLGRNDFEWFSEEPNQGVRSAFEDIVLCFPGLSTVGKELGDSPSPKRVWDVLFDDQMISEIVKWTNKKLECCRSAINETTSIDKTNKKNLLGKYRSTNQEELNGFLGVLLLSSIYKGPKESINSMFSKSLSGRPIMRAIMSVYRFTILAATLRFDNPETRDQRKANDKAAQISWLFEKFIANCKKPINIGMHTCIDEMLVPFRGRCPFLTYMPKNSAKCGIKMQCLTDTKTSYLYHAYIYQGKGSDGHGLGEEEKNLSVPTQAAIRLTKPIAGSGKNVTAGNWYCSVELCEEMRKRGLTVVCALKKDKRHIPPQFLPNPRRPLKSSLFGFSANKTLVSYVPKKNRSVILVSTMHHSKEIDSETGKPEIVMYYYKTKGGVDCLDMKCSKYSATRKSNRWPMAIFYRIVELASSNSHLLYICFRANPMAKRFKFVEQLAHELIRPQLEKRREEQNLSSELKDLINKALGKESLSPPVELGPPDRQGKRQTCKFCDYKLKRKTFYKCPKCDSPICLEHSRKICISCHSEDNSE